jgi:6-phosphofructokinase 1
MRVGVLTGGGDCPGLNAVIRAVTKSLLSQTGAEVIGIEDGFLGLAERRTRSLDWRSVSGITARGGTVLGTTNRFDPLASPESTQAALDHVRELRLDVLVPIGGDGTMTIAHAL